MASFNDSTARTHAAWRAAEAYEMELAERQAGPGASDGAIMAQAARLAGIGIAEMMVDYFILEQIKTVDDVMAEASCVDVQVFRDGLDGFLDDVLGDV